MKSIRHCIFWAAVLGGFAARGWRCYLVMERPPKESSWLEGIVAAGIEPIYVPRPRRHFDWAAVRRVADLCRQLHVDVIHCENIFCSPLLGALLARVPVRIWTQQNMLVWHAEGRSPTVRERVSISTRVACWVASRVIAVSQATRQELVDLGIAPSRVMVMHNPRPGPAAIPWDRAATRQELGYADDQVVLVTVGNVIPRKAYDVLLQAFAQVHARQPRARLLILGSHSAPAEQACFAPLQEFVRQHQLDSVVRFAGHVTDVPRYLHASDVFVFPTHGEACSFALLEAVAMGLPCVATNVGAAAQSVTHGVNGFVVPRADVPAFAAAVTSLVGDDALRARFAAAARVPASFPTDAELGLLHLELYEAFLRQQPPPAGPDPVCPKRPHSKTSVCTTTKP